jgi:acetyltransferase-like isoleucine patch superfamily enzyme
MQLVPNIFKALRRINFQMCSYIYTPYAKLMLFLNGCKIGLGLTVNGILKVYVTRRGKVIIGNNCTINSGDNFNIIGRQQKNTFWVEGLLTIGDNVGMSCSSFICNHEIEIGNNVTIGGNVVIYDTDFHSLNPEIRLNKRKDKKNAKWGKVVICDNAFIGAHSTILKGVTIGQNSIVGACSVVTKNIPANEVWAGNPAKLIVKLKC